MTDFEFIALVIAIPLGLTLVEIAQGVSTALRRRGVRIGVYTPLAAGLLVFNVALIFVNLFDSQDEIAFNMPILLFALVSSMGFYVAASFLVPDSPEAGLDLDEWFVAHRKVSLGLTFGLAIAADLFLFGDTFYTRPWDEVLIGFAVVAVGFSPVLLAIFGKRRRTIVVGLILTYLLLGLLVYASSQAG